MDVKKVSVTDFKAHCLQYMNEVHNEGAEFIVEKRGKPLVKIMPIKHVKSSFKFGYMKGTMKINDDIIAPLDVEWDAMKDGF